MLRKALLVLQAFLIIYTVKIIASRFNLHRLFKFVTTNKDFCFFNKDIKKNIKAIELSARFIPKSTCLIKSSALKLLTSKDEYDLSLMIGVKKITGFESHAWLVTDDHVIYGDLEDLESYKILMKLN